MTRRAKEMNDRLDRLFGVRNGGNVASVANWSGVDSTLLAECVHAVTAGGDGLVLGMTADGGAMALTVLAGDKRRRFYEHDCDAMDEVLRELTEWASKA